MHEEDGITGADLDRSTDRLRWTLALVVAYMAAEVVGGLKADSLALLADAGHMLSDAGSLSLALFAIRIARRPRPPRLDHHLGKGLPLGPRRARGGPSLRRGAR